MATSIYKTPKEVEEFMRTIYFEYKFNCLYEKDAEGCFLYANFLETIKKEPKGAFDLYKSTCDTYDHAKSCMQVGQCYVNGVGVEESGSKAVEYYVKACREAKGIISEKAVACANAGDIMLNQSHLDPSIKVDEKSGLEMLDIGCQNKVVYSCMTAADYLIRRARHSEAVKYLHGACELNNKEACELLIDMFSENKNVYANIKPNPDLVTKYKDKLESIKRQLRSQIKWGA